MREQLLQSIEKDGVLPPFPGIINQLREMIEDPNTGMDDVARVIQSDPILAGRLLQLANSVFGAGQAFYANNISRALGRLGLKMAMDLTYSLKLPTMFPTHVGFDYQSFWKFSLGLAVASSKLAELRGMDKDELSHAYLGGLMRNTGVLLLVHLQTERYLQLLKEFRTDIKNLQEMHRILKKAAVLEQLEQECFGIHNAEFATIFINKWWKMPPKVVEYVQNRPRILQNKSENIVEIARYLLWHLKVDDGITSVQVQFPANYFEQNFGIAPAFIEQLHIDLQAAFKIMR